MSSFPGPRQTIPQPPGREVSGRFPEPGSLSSANIVLKYLSQVYTTDHTEYSVKVQRELMRFSFSFATGSYPLLGNLIYDKTL